MSAEQQPRDRVVIEYVDPETAEERQAGNGAIYMKQRAFYHDRDPWWNDKPIYAWWWLTDNEPQRATA